MLGGDRAPPRRRAHPGARLDRPAAPDHRPADVLPLARAAALGRAGARAARRRRATGSSSTRRSGAGSRAPTRSSRSSSTGSRSRTSPGAGRSAGAAGSRPSGPRSRRSRRLAVTGPKADALLLAGWLRSRLREAGAADAPRRGGARARRGRRRGRSRRRGAGRRARATCSRPSSTSSAATGSTRPRSTQLADVEAAVRRDVLVKRPPASSTITATAAVSQIARPRASTATSAAPSATSMCAQKSPKPRRCQASKRAFGDGSGRARRGASRPRSGRCRRPGSARRRRERAAAAHGPPAPAERGGRDDADAVGEGDQRRPDRDPARVVPGPVDRVEDPAARVVDRPLPRRARARPGARGRAARAAPSRRRGRPRRRASGRAWCRRGDRRRGSAPARSSRRRRRARARRRGRSSRPDPNYRQLYLVKRSDRAAAAKRAASAPRRLGLPANVSV